MVASACHVGVLTVRSMRKGAIFQGVSSRGGETGTQQGTPLRRQLRLCIAETICSYHSRFGRGPGGSPIPPTPPLLGPKPKLEDLRTPSGFAAWGSFRGAHSMTRGAGSPPTSPSCGVVAASLHPPMMMTRIAQPICGRRLRYQRVEAFRFSSPLVSALLNLVDGCRKELLSVECLLLYFTQLFNLDAQHV